MLKAFIFNVDGTLADTEFSHRIAYNQAFADFGLDWYWDETQYIELLHIADEKERLLHYWRFMNSDLREINGIAFQDTLNRLYELKTAMYEGAVSSGEVQLRQGVLTLISSAYEQGLQLAIMSTTSLVNISTLLRRSLGPDWRLSFTTIFDASAEPIKIPNPHVYSKILHAMKLTANECLVFENTLNGLQASRDAGLATIITPTHYTASHDFTGALRVVPDLTHVELSNLLSWHSEFSNRKII